MAGVRERPAGIFVGVALGGVPHPIAQQAQVTGRRGHQSHAAGAQRGPPVSCDYAMPFVRFRQNQRRLQLSLVETQRDDRVWHTHVAGLGSVPLIPRVAARIACLTQLHGRLARLANRIDAAAEGRSSPRSTPASRCPRRRSSRPSARQWPGKMLGGEAASEEFSAAVQRREREAEKAVAREPHFAHAAAPQQIFEMVVAELLSAAQVFMKLVNSRADKGRPRGNQQREHGVAC